MHGCEARHLIWMARLLVLLTEPTQALCHAICTDADMAAVGCCQNFMHFLAMILFSKALREFENPTAPHPTP
jgi:hypothetical protein